MEKPLSSVWFCKTISVSLYKILVVHLKLFSEPYACPLDEYAKFWRFGGRNPIPLHPLWQLGCKGFTLKVKFMPKIPNYDDFGVVSPQFSTNISEILHADINPGFPPRAKFCKNHSQMSQDYQQELSYCRGWPTVREQLKRLCLHRRCVEYLATGNFYLLNTGTWRGTFCKTPIMHDTWRGTFCKKPLSGGIRTSV